MKKALVVGGSNGIGLAITRKLTERGYHVIVADKVSPDTELLPECCFEYIACDLTENCYHIWEKLSLDEDIDTVMVTAGFGRVAEFDYLNHVEIRRLFEVNTISVLNIIKAFYSRLTQMEDFYFGVMGSIAGMISSPMFSVYSATKAALFRFIESVNIELEYKGTSNRILNVSPGSIKGTRFNGGNNDLELTSTLSDSILEHMYDKSELFIPEYEEIFKGVLERYTADPHKFGMESYEYKKRSGRVYNEQKLVIGYLSGTFDLFHIGHLNLLKRAKENCDYLIVGVHDSGKWKGKETFIPLEERKAIVGACKYVDRVVDSCREDSDAWQLWHYDRLFVGSDYKGTERFNRYEEFFKDKGVEIIYFPYTQGTSSTQLRAAMSGK